MERYNLLVVSDLHLSEGVDPESGKYARQEDFLFDDAFARFLRYHERVRQQPRFGGRPWLLIFNGDLCDFPQVDALPEEGESLMKVKGVVHYKDLSKDERDFGLGTSEKESAWKLERIARGHPSFFAALGWFIAHGNHVAIIKGNHDLEFHWPAVRQRFAAEVDRAYAHQRQMLGEGPSITLGEIEERTRFYPWFYYEPDRVYIEHGGQYESSCHVYDYLDPVSCDNPDCLQALWGNLFVRYLFNQIEGVHPFADNVKPPIRYLGWAFSKAPLMTLGLIVTRGHVFLRAFWKVTRVALGMAQIYKQPQESDLVPLPSDVTREIAELAQQQAKGSRREWIGGMLMIGLTLVVIVCAVAAVVSVLLGSWVGGAIWAGAAVVFFAARRIARSIIPSFDDLMLRVAKELEHILKSPHAVRYIVVGHDHVADVERMEDTWYVNTGAWVQVFEKKGPIEGKEKLTFFCLAWGCEDVPQLLRWDDAVGEPASLRMGLIE
jgi:UDP-2,3-diacylglucosamine pyrophosphatase LpxH